MVVVINEDVEVIILESSGIWRLSLLLINEDAEVIIFVASPYDYFIK